MRDNDYFIGINGIEHVSQVRELADFVHERIAKVSVKVYVSNDTLNAHSLSDEKVMLKTKEIFAEARKYDDLVPVLHYSFRNSIDPLRELQTIKRDLPYVSYIQLDDLKMHQMDVLKNIADDYFVIYPLSDDDFELLSLPDFTDIIIEKRFYILLDNSCGRGVREGAEAYERKISKLLSEGIRNIALAGGFGPDYLDTYFEMVDYFHMNLSIDAASGLCSNGVFSIDKAKRYVGNLIAHTVKT